MDIKAISASRIKTYTHCKFKYIITYMYRRCTSCQHEFFTTEMGDDKCCPECGSKDTIEKVPMKSNWGAVHGTALHQIMEDYALAIRGTREDGTKLTKVEIKKGLDWKEALRKAYLRGTDNGQTDESFAIYDLAKPKDVENEKKWCVSCKSGKKNALCDTTGETLAEMNAKGCQGCPCGLFEESLKLTQKYVDKYDPVLKNRKILGVETFFDLDFGEVDIHGNPIKSIGYMDLVTELDEDTIEIIDHKFGKWVPSFEEFSEDMQAKLYSLAAKKVFPQYKECIVTFDYIRKSAWSTSFCQNEDEVTRKEVIDYWKKIAGPNTIRRTMVQGNGKDPFTSWKCKAMCDPDVCNRGWANFKERFGNGK